MISLDTLRADHLSIYGYHRNTSPFIDAFAKESVVFENAVAQAPWTLPSHMSIMTSLYPSFHGVVNTDVRLSDEHVTLAELLRAEGHQTAAFTGGGPMSEAFGFDQGFDIYDHKFTNIERILPKVKKWLDTNKSKPFFLFMHCFDIHDPYKPPPPYNTIFHNFTYTGNLNPSGKTFKAASKKNFKVTDEDIRHFIALYDGGIRYTDEKLGEFLSYLRDSGLEDQSLIIITSDHGEAFKEHGVFSHKRLYYRPNLHVPLIMRIPNLPKKGIRVNELVRSIDLLPTILDVAGLPAHPKAQGRSLLPLIKRKHKNVLKRSLWRILHPFRKDSNTSFAEHHRREYSSIITDSYQLIYNSKTNETQLFNLKDDPLAQNNIGTDHADITEQLLSKFREFYTTKPSYAPSVIDLDEATLKQLEALGYVDLPEHTSENANDIVMNLEQNDSDEDGIGRLRDNCPKIANPGQENIDDDFLGDACDNCVDRDWDGYGDPGFPNVCKEDNCPDIFNPDQKDTYPPGGNGIGDACECEGDLNCDGNVNLKDVGLFVTDFTKRTIESNPCTNENPCKGDFDCDRDVDEDDRAILKADFGRGKNKNPCPACEVGDWCHYELR